VKYTARSTRPITIECRNCWHDVGIFNGETEECVCEKCHKPVTLHPVRLQHLENGAGRRKVALDVTGHLYPKRNQYQQKPRPIERPRMELRLDPDTQRRLNALILARNETATDIIKLALREFASAYHGDIA
jgi:hypothetical protein